MTTRIFVQARMSSRRFPGKVLAPFAGRPLNSRVLDSLATVSAASVVVLTSVEPSDDPLACYLEQRGVAVFRGALDDVFGRFRAALGAHPCDWFVRVCADSPLIDSALVADAIDRVHTADVDLVTNVFPRTFPTGSSVEAVRAARFLEIDPSALTADEREHVTSVYYAHPDRFRIHNIVSDDPAAAATSTAVDTIEDLQRLERTFAEAARR